MIQLKPGGGEPAGDRLVRETKSKVGISRAQFLALVRREIDHQQASVGAEHARRFGNRRSGRLGVMQHLVDDDAVGALAGEREGVHVGLPQAGVGDPGLVELHPGNPKHFRRAIDAERLGGTGAEQFDHPPGTGADVEQGTERAVREGGGDGALDRAFGNVERADRVPRLGMGGEIARGGLGAIGANRSQALRIFVEQGAAVVVERLIDEIDQGGGARSGGQSEEHPAAFLVPVDQPRIGKNFDVARDPGLALAEHLRQFADRQFHRPQERDNAQPRRVGKRLKKLGQGQVPRRLRDGFERHSPKDIKNSLYPSTK